MQQYKHVTNSSKTSVQKKRWLWQRSYLALLYFHLNSIAYHLYPIAIWQIATLAGFLLLEHVRVAILLNNIPTLTSSSQLLLNSVAVALLYDIRGSALPRHTADGRVARAILHDGCVQTIALLHNLAGIAAPNLLKHSSVERVDWGSNTRSSTYSTQLLNQLPVVAYLFPLVGVLRLCLNDAPSQKHARQQKLELFGFHTNKLKEVGNEF